MTASHQCCDGAFGDQSVEVVCLGGGEFAHVEVVEDEDVRAGELA